MFVAGQWSIMGQLNVGTLNLFHVARQHSFSKLTFINNIYLTKGSFSWEGLDTEFQSGIYTYKHKKEKKSVIRNKKTETYIWKEQTS